jgi:hypothetical protein
MITFDRKSGRLTDAHGKLIATVWSGHGAAANDPSREREKGVGPLPSGDYKAGHPRDGGHLGPFVLDLVQISGESYGRGLFRVHGDHANDTDHSASDGCIIASLLVRQRIDAETDRLIRVV